MSKVGYADGELIDGIINRNEQVVTYVIELVWSSVNSFVLQNQGTKEDAMNVIQDAIMAIYLKPDKPVLSCKFTTFFYSICKRIWLNELRKKRNNETLCSDYDFDIEHEDSISEKKMYEKRRELYLKNLKKLSSMCQEVIMLVANGFSNKEIMEQMTFSSVQYTKNRKTHCNQRIINMIKSDPEYKDLVDGL